MEGKPVTREQDPANICYPKEIMCSAYLPRSKLTEFFVRFRREAEPEFFRVFKILFSKDISELSGFYNADMEKNEVVIGFFTDISRLQNKTAVNIAQEFRKIVGVLDVKFSERTFGELIIDELFFPLTVGGERSFTLRVESFGAILRRLYEKFGTGAAVILYEMGISLGESKAESVVRKYRVDKQTAVKIILTERAAKGWCLAEIEDLNSKKARIMVQELFECLPFKGKQERPVSQLFRGYLAGVFQKLYGRSFSVVEIDCIAKGDSACRFLLEAAK